MPKFNYLARSLTTGQNVALDDNNDTNWHHFVMTWNSSTGNVKYYKDGSLFETDTGATGSILSSDQGFVIGRDQADTSRDYFGSIIQPAFWSKELTTDEVLELNNSGNGKLYVDW